MIKKLLNILKFSRPTLLSGLTILVSVISLNLSIRSIYYSKEANEISKAANELAKKSNEFAKRSIEVAESSSSFEKKQRSSEIVDRQYDSIFENKELSQTMNKIINTNDQVEKSKLGQIIDVFENLGSKYCKGIVYKEDIRTSFSTSLYYLCNNKQIFNQYGNKKNATALLCYIFIPGSEFSQTFIKSTLKTCFPIE